MRTISRYPRGQKRAVSPIIATILLVAITVVLAAVLYILITGLTSTSSKPYTIGFGTGSPSTSNGFYIDTFSVSATSGLTTALFGLKITTPSGGSTGTTNASGCVTVGTSTVSNCDGPKTAGDWYAILVNSGGVVQAFYYGSSTTTSWSTTAPITASDSVVVISSSGLGALSGSADTLSAFGTGSSTVSGSITM